MRIEKNPHFLPKPLDISSKVWYNIDTIKKGEKKMVEQLITFFEEQERDMRKPISIRRFAKSSLTSASAHLNS